MAPNVTWMGVPGDYVIHAFAENAWMRSLCSELRWTAALETGSASPHCDNCESLSSGMAVVAVRPVSSPVDVAARRHAIKSAAIRRRWRRTS